MEYRKKSKHGQGDPISPFGNDTQFNEEKRRDNVDIFGRVTSFLVSPF